MGCDYSLSRNKSSQIDAHEYFGKGFSNKINDRK